MFRVLIAVAYMYICRGQLSDHMVTNCTDFDEFLAFRSTLNYAAIFNDIAPFQWNSQINAATYSCDALFQDKNEETCQADALNLDQARESNPKYVEDLSMGGNIRVTSFFIRDSGSCQDNQRPAYWSKSDIIALSKNPSTCGQYGNGNCELAFSKYSSYIHQKNGIVIGSFYYWAEAAAIRFGAKSITTVEYNPIQTNHRKVKITTPSQYAASFLTTPRDDLLVDFIISYSSLEHDGLGRYGDPLNAFGDLLSLGKAFCMLKPGGVLFLGLPIGQDEVQFNAHRIYGYYRLSIVLSLGFELVDVVSAAPFTINTYNGDSTQPVLVLRKPVEAV